MLLDHNVEDYLTGINCQIRGHINRSTIFTPARQLKTGIKNDDEAKPLSFTGGRTCITSIKMFKLLPLVWLALVLLEVDCAPNFKTRGKPPLYQLVSFHFSFQSILFFQHFSQQDSVVFFS